MAGEEEAPEQGAKAAQEDSAADAIGEMPRASFPDAGGQLWIA